MMRLNAPIPALLALAVLFFLPAALLAKTTHRLAQKNHRATAASSSRHAHRNIQAEPVRRIREAHPSRRHTAARPVLTRVHAQRPTRLQSRRHAARASREVAQPLELRTASRTAARTATSADFLKAAAEPPPVPAPISAPVAIHGTSRPDELDEAPQQSRQTRASSRSRADRPVAAVSVVRPASERPQLQSVEEAASTPVILPTLYNKRGRLIVPPALKGSHEILIHQNLMADHDGLDRIQNDDALLDMRNQRLLVAIPVSGALEVDERLPANRRYCRPWTAQFLATLARAHYAHFHTDLQVNSAVRTVEFQQHLMHINGNAAPAEGDTASPHLTGQAIDIAKHGLSLTEIAWMRGYLLPLVQEGKVDVEEEFQQSCFHISVYKRYLPRDATPRRYLASSHHSETTTLATAVR
jgi:Family of unknown function (DUF5715)